MKNEGWILKAEIVDFKIIAIEVKALIEVVAFVTH